MVAYWPVLRKTTSTLFEILVLDMFQVFPSVLVYGAFQLFNCLPVENCQSDYLGK